MKTQQRASQPPLSANELAQIDLARYACYPEMLFLHAIVQRGAFWHTALLQLEGGKVKYSSVNPGKFTLEEEARTACEQEHYRTHHLFKLVLPDFDIRPVWFK
jgi:hypothetical protein